MRRPGEASGLLDAFWVVVSELLAMDAAVC